MNLKLTKIFYFIIGLLIIGLVSNYKLLINYFDEPHTNTRNCIKEFKDQNIIGIEYECAIQEASKIYDQDKSRALQLCLEYSPMPDHPISKSVCKGAIEEELK